MSLSSQSRPQYSENPFEIFDIPSRRHPVGYSARRPERATAVPAMTVPRVKGLAPRPTLLTRNRKPLLSVKAVAGVLALLVLGFSLLPVPVQKRFYAFLNGSANSIQRMEPLPVAYDYISSRFGKRWGRQHQGIDFAAPQGSPIYATSAGTVISSGWEAGYGKSVVIDHGHGMQTRYAHCSKLLVKVGKVVGKGQQIAKVGSTGHSTGPHLHFEVIVDGVRKNPAWYYPFEPSRQPEMAQAKN